MISTINIFENWAHNYEKTVLSSTQFPFKGYKELMNRIESDVSPQSSILDIGIGTGILAESLFNHKSVKIYGIDQSAKMLEFAKNKLPNANLSEFDFNLYKEMIWEYPLFDCIIMTYFLHHYTLNQAIDIILFLRDKLTAGCFILIGDIGFKNEFEKNGAKKIHETDWDESEYYFVIEQLKQAFELNSVNHEFNIINEFCFYLKIQNL
jgi:putative AdoMet-dependent methyltransferase